MELQTAEDTRSDDEEEEEEEEADDDDNMNHRVSNSNHVKRS